MIAQLRLPLFAALLALLCGCSMNPFASQEGEQKPVVETTSDISIVWRSDLDQRQPASSAGMSNPAIATSEAGEVIVAGAQDKRVRILNSSGREIHRVALSAAGESGGLQLANGLVVVGDVGGKVFGIDINEGRVAWSIQLSSSLLSRPVLIGSDFIIQTETNQVFRFSQRGEKVWSYSGPPAGLGMQLLPSPVVFRDQVYVAMRNGDVVALKAESGSFLWQRQLLINSDAAVLRDLKVPVATPLLIPAEQSGKHEDMLAVPVFQGELFFLSLQDGSTLMSRAISSKGSPLLIGNRVYVADAQGALSMLDAAGGETLWKQKLSDVELTGPIFWNQMLWLADESGKVFRLNLDGKLLATVELGGRIDLTPVASSDGVLVRNNLGTLFKLR
ncbi:PQQ-binding-like beta-propeller repeat protein [Mariprofundus sp. KV]|uniref:outer membrane protein assembly factor BamB family protein n=1 Tax=Mariprofundus sp. KV TaxID=2608715 RepID=UPI0015A3E424|nr:PQQ-binding-like beta-propeller repeat protein [Mariprofundus sp. KV]NWF35605.1 PQQ-binding-like beta-propeller repeat protein [Mariprofundus sp. KV]